MEPPGRLSHSSSAWRAASEGSSSALSSGKEESRPLSEPASNATLSVMRLDLTTRRRRRIVCRVSEASSAAGIRALGAPTGHADQVTSPLLADRSMILDFKTEADMEKF